MEQHNSPPALPAIPVPPALPTSSQPLAIRQSSTHTPSSAASQPTAICQPLPHPPSIPDDPIETTRNGSEASPSCESEMASDASDLDGQRFEVEDGAPEMDGAASGFAWQRRVMHFLRLERISPTNYPLVELAVLIECGQYIVSLGAMKNDVKYPRMMNRYLAALDEFEDSDYESSAVRETMKYKLYRAQSGHTGRKLWDKYVEVRSECRTLADQFPRDLSRIPTRNQLHDIYKKFLHDRYLKIYPADDDDLEDDGVDIVMPENWWLRGKDKSVWSHASGIRCLLAVQVNPTSKEISADCTSQPAGVSRVDQRIEKANEVAAVRAKAKEKELHADPYAHKDKKPRNDLNAGVFSDQDVIGANQKLLDAIAAGDYATYSDLTAADLTAVAPESRGHPVHGRAFHKYYFDLSSHPAPTTAISMSNPHVRWLGGIRGSDGGEGTAAILTYVRLEQTMRAGDVADGGGPVTKTMGETRVWENRDGKLINVHFQKS